MGRRIVSGISGNNIVGSMSVDSSTITSLLTNANITLVPNGTGDVYLSADTLRVGDQNIAATITTWGTGNLTLSTNEGTNSGTILINNGANTNIEITPNGSGDVFLSTDLVRIGDQNIDATLTTWGTGNLVLNTNSGTNSGSLTIAQGTNGAISLVGNGTATITIGAATNSVSLAGTTNSTSSSTGSVVFEGGVGIKKALNVGTTLTVAGGAVNGVLTAAFSDSTTTFDGNNYVTGYVANGVTYSLITYELVSGTGSTLGGQYRRVISWRETDNVTSVQKNYTVAYSANGRVSTITVV